MKALVVYDSRSGYTEAIAIEIGKALNQRLETTVVRATECVDHWYTGLDLLVVGGPTEAHSETPALRGLLGDLGSGALAGLAAAAFDTRLHWPKLLSGSAAEDAAKHLRAAGCHLLVPPESFLVAGKVGRPDEVELQHARTWADQIMSALPSPVA